MGKRRGTGVYNKDDLLITTKVSPEIHKYLYDDAKSQFRTLPAHVAAILTNHCKVKQSGYAEQISEKKAPAKARNVLYTDQELQDMQTQYNERENNGRI